MSVILGKPVPDFLATATSGLTVTSSKLRHKNILLYFYPKDNTPGCTKESISFRDYYQQFTKCDAEIFGVSQDSLESHENFRKKYNLPFQLIADTDAKLCVLFDVIKLKQMYGKEYIGIERSTFLIDKQGILQSEWRKVRLKNHVEEVLQTVQAINAT
jgi:peroxiredoxin Q/BCP